MDAAQEKLHKWLKEQKLPYVKKLDSGFYEVFDGRSKTIMSEDVYKRFDKAMQKEGEKYLNKKP